MGVTILDRNSFKNGLEPLVAALRVLGEQSFPRTQTAIKKAAYYISDFWIQSAQGNPIPGTDKTIRDDEYARSIEAKQMGKMHWVIGSNNPTKHKAITEGAPERDMKLGLPGYKKVKHNKRGEPFLTVPFRHKVENLKAATRTRVGARKPETVYKMISPAAKATVTANLPSQGQRSYGWKKAAVLPKIEEQIEKPWHKRDVFAGLVRFDTSTGMASSSSYMTFRTISIHSAPEAWIIPPKPGLAITELVFEATKQKAVEMIEAGIGEDFRVVGLLK